ncbi:MAG: HD domain-containing phosphohydrolase [Pseudomonadota bacterium]
MIAAEGLKPTLLLADAGESPLVTLAIAQGWRVARDDLDVADSNVALVVLGEPSFSDEARVRFPGALFVGSDDTCRSKVDVFLGGWTQERRVLEQILRHAEDQYRLHRKLSHAESSIASRRQQVHQLAEMGAALAGPMKFEALLEKLLSEARNIAACDGATLFLIEDEQDEDEARLYFKLAQSGSVVVNLSECRMPRSTGSVAGYVAVTGEEINVPDVYRLPTDAPFEFNRTYDEQFGYRTRSMLVLPMCDHDGEVVGVLQFINRFEPDSGEVVPFEADSVEILRAIAAQAALSVQKSRLIKEVNALFEGFVQASVKAIEQRDPSTSGHSARVAESTVALLQALPMSGNSRFRSLHLTEAHLTEVRYAALLHDFGKVGVREALLVKSHKLPAERIEILAMRIALQKERLRRKAAEREVHLLHDRKVDFEVARARVHRELAQQITRLDDYMGMIERANQPSVVDSGEFHDLREILEQPFVELDGSASTLISPHDVEALSVRRGSLTAAERREIEAHVVHTKDFLSVLPWPNQLKEVPAIAGAHHEKLDGSGYPDGLKGEEIPLASRVMAVCDIYDALTAMDRPYKSSVSPDVAFGILHEESKLGLLDADLVDIFIDQLQHKASMEAAV